MRVVASSSISQSTQVCSHTSGYFTVTFSCPSGLNGSTMKWKQSVARPRARGVRGVACSVSLMNRLNQKYSFSKCRCCISKGSLFQIILYVMVICISASKKMRVKFFQNKVYLQLFWDNQKINNNLRLLLSVKTLHGHSGSD